MKNHSRFLSHTSPQWKIVATGMLNLITRGFSKWLAVQSLIFFCVIVSRMNNVWNFQHTRCNMGFSPWTSLCLVYINDFGNCSKSVDSVAPFRMWLYNLFSNRNLSHIDKIINDGLTHLKTCLYTRKKLSLKIDKNFAYFHPLPK